MRIVRYAVITGLLALCPVSAGTAADSGAALERLLNLFGVRKPNAGSALHPADSVSAGAHVAPFLFSRVYQKELYE